MNSKTRLKSKNESVVEERNRTELETAKLYGKTTLELNKLGLDQTVHPLTLCDVEAVLDVSSEIEKTNRLNEHY